MSNIGFIKVFRTSLDNPIYKASKDEPFDKWHAWEDLLLCANYRTTRRMYKGSMQATYPGQLQTSTVYLAGRWHWSRNKVDRFLTLLEEEKMITRNGTPYGTTITIENWRKFQVDEAGCGASDEATDGAADGATDGAHKKNIKKYKNIKNPPNPPEGGTGGGDFLSSSFDAEKFLERLGEINDR